MSNTRQFGSGDRESHDASEFYSRFNSWGAFHPCQDDSGGYAKLKTPEEITAEVCYAPGFDEPRLFCGNAKDAGQMLPEKSVGLIVTSPPYFVGKEYELDERSPKEWEDYLEMLSEVFSVCHKLLETGGRIAVNIANLGRRPYRSLSAKIIEILEDIGYLHRCEIIWKKGKAQSGSCAWGSFMSPTNPVFKDLTERIVVASKACFQRVGKPGARKELGLPHEATIGKEDFMAWVNDVWECRPESARRVGHPAPFPVEIPRRLIELYTFKDDLVFDPFMGSGSTLVAALQAGRRAAGIDLKPDYVELAAARVADALEHI